MIIPDHIRTFLSEPHYATVATIDADGGPRQATVWYRFEGDAIVLNSLAGRTWPNNLLRDGRVSIAVRAGGDGYQWVGLTGVAKLITDQVVAQADIAEMAGRYHAHEPEVVAGKVARFQSQERITFRVPIQAIHEHLD